MSESHPALPSFFQQFKPAEVVPTLVAEPAPVPVALAPSAPFPVGARLRYVGIQRLFAGYQSISILEPGREYAIAATAGAYSVYVADVGGTKYDMVISAATKGDWLLIE